jgi:hypothetical protein
MTRILNCQPAYKLVVFPEPDLRKTHSASYKHKLIRENG